MIDLLLAHAYYLAEDAAEQRVMKPYAPLGILSLSAFMKRAGYDVRMFDSTFRTIDDFAREVRELRPRMVGISVNMMTKFAAIRMIAIARDAGCFVVLGGPEPPHHAGSFLNEGADAIVIGEGEHTLHELADCVIRGEGRIEDIAGLVVMGPDGSAVHTPPRALERDIDSLPLPDRGAIDLTPYMQAWKQHHGYSSLSLITMRGCPYTCTWCSHAVYGESSRRRSPASVADEIAELTARHAPDAFWFADDVFTISHPWLYALQSELDARGLRIRFECITRADRLDARSVAALRDMGCARVWIGAESGSQRILDAMQRGVKIEQVESMTRACREAGIEVGTFIMLGYLGETRSDIVATARYLRRSRPDHVLTTVAYPIRGTRYHTELGDRAQLPDAPFRTWNDRMHTVHGRYSARFYRFATRYVVNAAAASRLRAAHAAWHSVAAAWGKAAVSRLAIAVLR